MALRDSTVSFQIFRYQILPFESEKQFDIESPIKGIRDIAELKERKNDFFSQVLSSISNFDYAYSEITHKIIYDANDRIIIKMGSQKNIELTHKDFSIEEYEDWTPIAVYISFCKSAVATG